MLNMHDEQGSHEHRSFFNLNYKTQNGAVDCGNVDAYKASCPLKAKAGVKEARQYSFQTIDGLAL
jgi:hypothetical protein